MATPTTHPRRYIVNNTNDLKKYKPSDYVNLMGPDGKRHIYLRNDAKPIAGTVKDLGANYATAPVPATDTPATPTPPQTYDQWLQGAGSPYAGTYSDTTLNQDFGMDANGNLVASPDNYYGMQLGSLENDRIQAAQDLATNTTRTTTNIGEGANSRGLYGSGIYQNDLNQALGDLNTNYNRNWGEGPYTSYSQRKMDAIQNARTARESAALQRKKTAFDVYSQQYLPVVTQGT